MFLENKYTKWYNSIINKSKNRINEEYTEIHHVVPRSLGGDNSEENLTKLTAKEHFVCHLLLTKMTTGAAQHKMIKAARLMSMAKSRNQNRYKVTGKIYSLLKADSELPNETRSRMSQSQIKRFINSKGTFTGKTHSLETREKIRQSKIGTKDSDEVRIKKSISAKNRPTVTEETKRKISLANKGRPGLKGEKNGFFGKTHSEEQREKKRQEKLNSIRQQCPHCSKIADIMNYARWHGNNCKSIRKN